MAISAKQNRATVSTELQAQPTDGAEQGARSLQLIVQRLMLPRSAHLLLFYSKC